MENRGSIGRFLRKSIRDSLGCSPPGWLFPPPSRVDASVPTGSRSGRLRPRREFGGVQPKVGIAVLAPLVTRKKKVDADEEDADREPTTPRRSSVIGVIERQKGAGWGGLVEIRPIPPSCSRLNSQCPGSSMSSRGTIFWDAIMLVM